jgi:Calpain family cysteine protease
MNSTSSSCTSPRSPFSLARALASSSLDWEREPEPAAAVQRLLGAPLEALLRDGRSPVFARCRAELEAFYADLPAALGEGPEARAARIDRLVPLLREAPEQGGALGAQPQVFGGNWLWRRLGDPLRGKPAPEAPVQGPLLNCTLLAAMSALQSASPPLLRFSTQEDPATREGLFALEVYEGGWRSVVVDETLPSTRAGQVAFARSAQPGEYWPGLVEKAVASHLRGRGERRPATYPFQPMGLIPMLRLLSGHDCAIAWSHDQGPAALLALVQQIGRDGQRRIPATAASRPQAELPSGLPVASAHAFTVLGYLLGRSGTHGVLLRDPLSLRVGEGVIGEGLEEEDVLSSPWAEAWHSDRRVRLLSLELMHRCFDRLAIVSGGPISEG